MLTVFLLALALSADAFAAAVARGASAGPRPGLGRALKIGAVFGLAQGVMPLLGWTGGRAAADVVQAYDHWLAFALLGAVGVHMILEALKPLEADQPPLDREALWPLLVTAVATSLDAAAAGVTLAFRPEPVLLTCAVIAAVTFAVSTLGVLAGATLGSRIGRRAELLGGLVLIALGTRILVEHLAGRG